ncbi:MAG: ATP-binding protein [bacterium]
MTTPPRDSSASSFVSDLGFPSALTRVRPPSHAAARLWTASPCMTFRWSPQRGVERVAGNASGVVGLDDARGNPSSIRWDDWIVPDDRERVVESRRVTFAEQTDGAVSYRVLPRHGSGVRFVRELLAYDPPTALADAGLEGLAFLEPGAGERPTDPDLGEVDEKALLKQALKRLVESQERLVRQEKLVAVGELVGGVAHELNNPLTSIIGFAELALRSCDPTPAGIDVASLAQDVRCIHDSALRCQRIVRNLLRFSRKYPPVLVPHDLNDSMRLAAELLSYELATQNVKVVLDLAPSLPYTLVDPHQMEMVLVNLINNAFHAIRGSNQSGTIRLSSSSDANDVVLEIADTGPGIPNEIRYRIFDPFFTTKPVGEGTGLGLSLSHGIVAEHEGSIDVANAPGSGAVFTIRLPIRSERPNRPSALASVVRPSSDPRANEPIEIALIDDEAPLLDALSRGLNAHGCQVRTASAPDELMKGLVGRMPDAILIDLWMPGTNGMAVYERLAAERPELKERVVFVSGDVGSGSVQETIAREGRPYLEKPLRASEVVKTVRELKAARRVRERNAA